MKLTDFLSQHGLTYEELTPSEEETISQMYAAAETAELTIEKIKAHVNAMKQAVEEDLCKPNLEKNQDTYLKARLRNYMLFEAFLQTPDKVKAEMETALKNYKTSL